MKLSELLAARPDLDLNLDAIETDADGAVHVQMDHDDATCGRSFPLNALVVLTYGADIDGDGFMEDFAGWETSPWLGPVVFYGLLHSVADRVRRRMTGG